MSLYDVISSLKIKDDMKNRIDLYSSIKLISNYIKGETSKLKKSDLIKIVIGLNYYLENKIKLESRKINFKSGSIELDEEQYKILVSSINQNQRIIAGAGSGKTTTILCRVKYLLDNFICPDRILILTFNRDSAQNIRNRIDDLFGFPVHLNIYTIDAFCCKLMNLYGKTHDKFKSNAISSLSEYSSEGLKIMKLYGKEISLQFTNIFFDEFQDVNDIQFQILKIFVDMGSNLTVIGDDCQNIYQFRGTNNYYMVNFDRIIKNVSTYKLTTNYRSTKLIVDMANDSIEWNSNRVKKTMKAYQEINDDYEKIKPKLIVCGSDCCKFEYVIKKIETLIKNGFSYGDIAILSRNSYSLKCMETELTKFSIPHVALITDKNSDDNKKLIDPEKIALTTIHKSKGLEWNVVIILGLAHAHFPEHLNNNIKNIEEERRLFYVAITRSKKYLLFISSINEIPLSIFINEVRNHINISYYKSERTFTDDELFNISNTENTVKLIYGVNEMIGYLQTSDYNFLRKKDLIIDKSPDVITIFDAKLQWSENINKGAFEPDFGEFVDRYITRGICCKLKKEFIDTDTEFILYQDENSISKEDFEKNNIFQKLGLNIKKINNMNNNDKINCIVKKIQEQNLIRNFTYPQNIINRIKIAYENVKNVKKQNNDLEEDIYWISLCRNFRLERSRLAYKNIYVDIKDNFYMGLNHITKNKDIIDNLKNNTIRLRSDFYINKYGILNSENVVCKIFLEHKFKNKLGNKCSFMGEIDMLYWDEVKQIWILIDFKCSESDFKIEWELQLLTYYSLIKNFNLYDNIEISQIGIINILDGKEYYLDIPKNYDYLKLINFYEEKIELDQLSIRPKPNLKYILNTNEDINNLKDDEIPKINNIVYKNDKEIKKYSMTLDTETTDFTGDIIQIAWIITDPSNNNKIIKKSNKFIKNRIPSTQSEKIHNINIEKLRKEGLDFYIVMNEFIEDLFNVNKIIGHNISFDLRIITNNLRKFSINIIDSLTNNMILNVFENFEIICTKKLSGGKSLSNLYFDLFDKTIEGAHDALVDVEKTFECYCCLINKNNNVEKMDFIV
jgi:DNA polymerase III epsilon subunit-like protein